MNKVNGNTSQPIITYEHAYLIAREELCAHSSNDSFSKEPYYKDCSWISPQSFGYLEKLCLSQDDKYKVVFKLCFFKGRKAIKLLNYVGVIQTPSGEHIEVLPKIARTDVDLVSKESEKDIQERSRKALINMLMQLKSFRHIKSENSQIQTKKMPLLEVFIGQFLESVNRLVKRGIRSNYVRREDNQAFLKGKLLVSQQLKHNLVRQDRFYVEYDEYLQDTALNRVIHTALNKVSALTRINAHQKLCRELSFAFADVPLSCQVKQDLKSIKLDRGMAYYESPLAWARLILEGDSPISMHGQANAMSMLFRTEALFEAYVGSILKPLIKSPYLFKGQAKSKTLLSHGNKDWFQLKPDFLIQKGNQPSVILDAKWKRLNGNKANGTDKYGLSQSDFYQMFAYGHKYLDGRGDMVLIYPACDTFKEPVEASFDFNEQLKLWVVPFDLNPDTKNSVRLRLPAGFSSLYHFLKSDSDEV